MITKPELQKDFLSWFLLKKLSESLSDIEIEFSYLIITFLNMHYCGKNSFLNEHDPFIKVEREKIKESSGFLKFFMKDDDIRIVTPSLYIPVRNGKIKEVVKDVIKMEKVFKEKWNFDINSLMYEEFGPSANFYAQNLEEKGDKNQKK